MNTKSLIQDAKQFAVKCEKKEMVNPLDGEVLLDGYHLTFPNGVTLSVVQGASMSDSLDGGTAECLAWWPSGTNIMNDPRSCVGKDDITSMARTLAEKPEVMYAYSVREQIERQAEMDEEVNA